MSKVSPILSTSLATGPVHSRPAQATRESSSAEASHGPTQPEPFVDARRAGYFLQLQPRRVLQLARQGRLPAYPIGDGPRKVWRFRLSDLANSLLHSRQRSHVPEEL
jgi:hypothetical protein